MFTEWFSTATTQAQTFITLALDYDKSVLSLKHPKYHQLNHLKTSLWDRTPLPLPHSQQSCSTHRSHFRFHCQQTQSRPPSLGLMCFTTRSRRAFLNLPLTISLPRPTLLQASCRHSHLHCSARICPPAHPPSILCLCSFVGAFCSESFHFCEALSNFHVKANSTAYQTHIPLAYTLAPHLEEWFSKALTASQSQSHSQKLAKFSEGFVEMRRIRERVNGHWLQLG